MGFEINTVLRGRVWKFGDSVETDAINPYYRYPTMDELKLHTMEAYRPEFASEVRPGDILVAGRNFGCGSSRPGLVLREVGIAAIVVESVARLFLRNSVDRAIPIFLAPGVTSIVEDGETLVIDYPAARVTNATSGASVALRKFPPLIEQIYRVGGLPEFARERYLREQQARTEPPVRT
ncbi:MAG TPA: 3-isopropylmalate dehydratase small subunit [Casimicrobiaceae bacterium]|jgi:3-isopropylmalate dehydratase small subunit|nr:3-isopropylmalate dehydratase small subunit [Casimicrobiaceae bacterium]